MPLFRFENNELDRQGQNQQGKREKLLVGLEGAEHVFKQIIDTW